MRAKSDSRGNEASGAKTTAPFPRQPSPIGSAILTQIHATYLTAPPMARSTPPKTLPDRRTRAPIPRPVIDVSSSNSDDNDAHPDPKTPLVMDISSDGEGYEDASCEECGSGESGEEMLLCDKCDKGYHLFCLRPILVSVPKGLWVCPPCSNRKKLKSFPLVQTKIIDFFRIRTSWESTQKLVLDAQKKRRRPCRSLTSKKKRRLLPFNPIDGPVRRMEQMASLATALLATGAQFSNQLTYSPSMARRSANRAAIEKGGMQVLCKEDVGTLNLCKSMMEKGIWPPLMVVFDPQEGFTVEADRFIRDLTIVTEYAGDVDYLENREDYDGDSMMTLLSASNPSRSLVICPDKHANIARFINGINNHTPEGKKKQNLKCVRFDVDGECRVLLIANRDITKGERLYYDYNGSEHEYPTEHFL